MDEYKRFHLKEELKRQTDISKHFADLLICSDKKDRKGRKEWAMRMAAANINIGKIKAELKEDEDE